MSDLAPFVAAVLRDKVVAEMLEENRQLRKQLSYSRKVEVVVDHKQNNQNVTVVLAEGSLEKGHLDAKPKQNDKPKFIVNFSRTYGCPLRVLGKARIRMGGVRLKSPDPLSSESVLRCHWTQTPWLDSLSSKGVVLESGSVSLVLVVYGWLWDDWYTVLRNRADGGQEPLELVDYLLHVVPRKYPRATVAFHSVQLCPAKYKGPIENLTKRIPRSFGTKKKSAS